MKKVNITILFLLCNCKNSIAQNYTLAWSDSFNTNPINSNNWVFEAGTGNNGWGNNELQYYTNRPENATIQNGNLMIIAKKELYAGSDYTSARITTKGLQEFTYGKIEARIKLNQTQGVWPAFWMLGGNIGQVNWPECAELDIMEHINTESKIHGTMHWNNNGHVYLGTNVACNVTTYHNYGIEWTNDSLIWMLDNNVFYKQSIKNNVNNTAAFHKPFFLLLNIAVGGNWPGSPNANAIFPDTMFIDYVTIFQKFALSIDYKNRIKAINIFPNPVQNALHIEMKNVINENKTICIYNQLGVFIKSILLEKNQKTYDLPISELVSGNYYYRIDELAKGGFRKE